MLPSWWLPYSLLLSPVICKTKLIKTSPPTTPDLPLATPAAPAASNTSLEDRELDLPPPSLLRSLYDTTIALVETSWSDSEAVSRQGTNVGPGIRISLSSLLALLLVTAAGIVGFGSVGLLAAKALAVGTLALFLAGLSALKKHHSGGDSGGQTVHYVPIQAGHHHHDIFHERSELLPPYLDRNV